MKLVILNSHPIQYMAPFYKFFDENYSDEIELELIYFSDYSVKGGYDNQFGTNLKWDIPLLDGYTYKFIKNYSPIKNSASRFFGMINPQVFFQLKKDKPDAVIIPGWSNFSYLLGFLSCVLLGIDIWVRLETPLNQEVLKKSLKSRVKRWILKSFYFNKVKRCLYIGQENKKFFEYFNVPEENLFFTPYSVDNDRFQKDYQKYKNVKESLRNELNIPPNATVFLTSGKLIGKKRPMDLMQAFYEAKLDSTFLIFLGDGDLREKMEAYASSIGFKNYMITGFKNQTELAPYFVMSDVFVLCSGLGETWGLVTNEAMNFNLPLIVSDRVGSVPDLVRDGFNGHSYKYACINDLVAKLRQVSQKKEELKVMGVRSGEIIKNYSFFNMSQGVLEASRYLKDS